MHENIMGIRICFIDYMPRRCWVLLLLLLLFFAWIKNQRILLWTYPRQCALGMDIHLRYSPIPIRSPVKCSHRTTKSPMGLSGAMSHDLSPGVVPNRVALSADEFGKSSEIKKKSECKKMNSLTGVESHLLI